MTKSVVDELAGLELPVERGCPFGPPTEYERLREQAPICELLGVPYTDHDFFQSRTTVAVRRTGRGRAVQDGRRHLRRLRTPGHVVRRT